MPIETPPPLSEEASVNPPISDSGAAGAPSSPSAVREAEAQLILRHTRLTGMLPGLELASKKAAAEFRNAKAEMVDIVRILRAHERLKSPRKRTK